MAKIEIDLGTIPLPEVPEKHRLKAEVEAKRAFVMALVEQGDLSPGNAILLMSACGIPPYDKDTGIDLEAIAYMERQGELFDEMRSELLSQYHGKYVLFEERQVLDADQDEAALRKRVEGENGHRYLFIEKVLPEAPQLMVRTPFGFRSASLG